MRILDTESEQIFDEITQLAAAICGTPISLVSLIDEKRQWFKSALGLPGALANVREAPREISFCGHVVAAESFLEIEDTAIDQRFADNPFVTGEARVRFYAGAPLTSRDGYALGSLCVIDHEPRRLTQTQRDALRALARHVVSLLEAKIEAATLLGERENLNALLENLTEGVALIDETGIILDVNAAATEVWRRPREVLIGERFGALVERVLDQNGLPIAEPNYPIATAMRTREVQRGIMGLKRMDQTFAWIAYTVVPLAGPTATDPGNLLATFHDVTASRNAELELRRLSGLKELVLDHTQFGVIACGLDGKISLFNAMAEKLTGFSAEEVIGKKSPAEFHDPGEVTAWSSFVLSAMMEPNREWKFRHRAGRIFPVSLAVVELKDDAGEAVGYLGLVEDLTEKKQLAAAVEQQRLTLINNAKMASLGEMAGGMAHEVNNPLAIICASAEELMARAQAGTLKVDEILPTLRQIDDTAGRIAKIVRGLKTFSRSSELDPLTLVPVRQIVEETLGLCRERFRVNGVQLRVDVPDKLLINCRPTQISQVLLNLLNNAFDATEGQENRWVTLSALVQGAQIHVVVTDSGPAIPLEVRDRLMEPFFSTKDVGKGTGLGLSISKGIIEGHGGRFFLREDVTRTTFVFELPNYSGRKSV